ncbi:bifunctional phosphoribosyl-AMP cyclohydrolase/phosphoribosyl-ATP diphosphatase HisIE [Patescibacteria group bacterium]|nr:bifunctional phosphoribosyl-AMP cyclohydrolase/phosphoribosyl-ATP diphosphatase HisIE [Patescibacteria group bacterium]MBU1123524.1 bifunctional phosphoribosyl-AMP cyclohydrolase/phosphoribosyl-ATP diphosphatase HisIE [Patescibacteria group bacterium]MBU1911096.1 bifunctional phosphoribosyl-AMP cyclohydrolase/phosphoribosyl-ATP diphosphatase HisIE [Patescibacteria group bacterium]
MIDTSTINWQKNCYGLVPAVIQDVLTGQVLMLGYMNQESLEFTIKTELVTFFSRSKQRLWTKGEVSGNSLRVVSIDSDCDNDAILVRVMPNGPTCHTGIRSCFGEDKESALETIGLLIRTIQNRSIGGSNDSYTQRLLKGGKESYGAKVLEEAQEVVRATKLEGKQRTIEEVADLLYHLLVLLRGEEVEIEEVSQELRKRRKSP